MTTNPADRGRSRKVRLTSSREETPPQDSDPIQAIGEPPAEPDCTASAESDVAKPSRPASSVGADLDVETRLQMAAAVAATGVANRLDEHNARVGHLPLEEAVEQDVPYYVRVDSLVLAVDFDSSTSERDAAELHLELLLAGHHPVTLSSGGTRDGSPGRHVFVWLPTERQHQEWAEQARRANGDVRRDIRPPLALHRSGRTRSIPVLPASFEVALSRLAEGPVLSPLSSASRSVVEVGLAPGADRSTALFRLAVGLARLGWVCDEVLLLLKSPRYAVSADYSAAKRRRNHRGDGWFEHYIWPRAQHAVRNFNHGLSGTLAHVRGHATEQILLRTTDRSTRFTDLKVLEAILQCAERVGRLTVGMSVRQIAEAANVGSNPTVVKSVSRLLDDRYIRRAPAGTKDESDDTADGWPMRARRYEVQVPPESSEWDPIPPYRHLLGATFRQGRGLGSWAGVVYEFVYRAADGATLTELVASTGSSARAVGAALRRLAEQACLVECRDGRWFTTDVQPRDDLIEPASAAARAARNRHEIERHGFAEAWGMRMRRWHAARQVHRDVN